MSVKKLCCNGQVHIFCCLSSSNNITTTQSRRTHLLLNLLHGHREEASPSVRTNCPPLGVSHGRKEERGNAWSRLHAPPPHRPCTHNTTHTNTLVKSRLNKVSGGVADETVLT
jgi:hypothetical protein